MSHKCSEYSDLEPVRIVQHTEEERNTACRTCEYLTIGLFIALPTLTALGGLL